MTDRRTLLLGLGAAAALAAAPASAQNNRKSKAKAPAAPPLDPALAATAKLDPAVAQAIDAALAGANRSDANKARDAFRKPKETLAFFGVTPASRVLEVIPGGGWYTEVLAPYLKEKGQLYLWAGDPNVQGQRRGLGSLLTKLASDPAYEKARVDGAWASADARVAGASLDTIVTFRNVHNLVWFKTAEASFKQWFDALKPGGVLGIEDHRWPEGVPNTMKPKTPFNAPDNGYITESAIIALASGAGFKLAEKSEILANAKDTKDYEQGVWALPPTLIGGEKDPNRAKFLAIGESDRMLLKFVKPA